MDKKQFSSSEGAVKTILSIFFKIENPVIARNKNGKPYLENHMELFFSVSHTNEKLFIAFSDKNVGIDAEPLNRSIQLRSLLKKIPAIEQPEIQTPQDFLIHWTARESAVKWLDSTLAEELKKLVFVKRILQHTDGNHLPRITQLFIENHSVSVCCERDFSTAEQIHIQK